jgi:site-specific DNA-methyltransferase (adenine-specific)
VVQRFKDQVSLMLEDLENPIPLNRATSSLQCASAYDLKKAVANAGINKKVGLVVFSPPYANSFNYFESYKMELLAGGYCKTRDDIYEMSKNAVRSFRMVVRDSLQGGLPILDLLVEEIEAALPRKEAATGKRDSRTRIMLDVIKAYFLDMQKVIKEVYAVLCKSGRCYIVVDQSSYVGVVVPTDLLLARIGELEGFRVSGVQKCRKANTSGQQLREYPYLKHCLRESIVCLEKN